MNITLWIVQGILAFVFLMAGLIKLSQPKHVLRKKIGYWVDSYTDGAIKTIGLTEVLGAIGLVLPMALNIIPSLTIVAAAGLSITMIGAIAVHLKRKEMKEVTINLVLLLLTVFVLVGRLYISPIF